MRNIHALIRKVRLFVRHPDKVRGGRLAILWPATSLLAVSMILRTWRKIEREKIRHDRHVTAVKVAFSQDKFKIYPSWQMRDLIYDLNDVLHPAVIQLFIRSLFRHFYKGLYRLKCLFKFTNAFFKFFDFPFQESSPVGCGDHKVDDGDRGCESSVATGGAE